MKTKGDIELGLGEIRNGLSVESSRLVNTLKDKFEPAEVGDYSPYTVLLFLPHLTELLVSSFDDARVDRLSSSVCTRRCGLEAVLALAYIAVGETNEEQTNRSIDILGSEIIKKLDLYRRLADPTRQEINPIPTPILAQYKKSMEKKRDRFKKKFGRKPRSFDAWQLATLAKIPDLYIPYMNASDHVHANCGILDSDARSLVTGADRSDDRLQALYDCCNFFLIGLSASVAILDADDFAVDAAANKLRECSSALDALC